MSDGWDVLEQGKSLLDSGNIDAAIALLHRAAEMEVGEACIELARIERDRGNRAASLSWLKRAEHIADIGDALANLSCYFAYQLMLGEGNLDEQQARANGYLAKAAELGNPVAQTLHAQQLFSGLNGETPNEAEYYRWIMEAIKQGAPDAILTHVQNMLRVNRPVEPDVKCRLEQLAVESKAARQLLERLNSRKRR